MRRIVFSFAVLGLVAPFALQGWAGDQDAGAIIEKAIKAHFPKGVDKKNKGVRTKGKGTLNVAGLTLDFTQEVVVEMPDKLKEVMDLEVMNKKVHVVTVFNGKEGWIRADDKDIPVNDDILEELKEAAYGMSLAQGLFLKDKTVKFTALGEVNVKGKPAVGITLSREGKKAINLFFDKATGLMTKVEARRRDLMSGQEVTEERFITEYQDVADRKVAKKVTVQRDGKDFITVEVLEVQIQERIDPAEFAQPN